jgi:hypothetical protein
MGITRFVLDWDEAHLIIDRTYFGHGDGYGFGQRANGNGYGEFNSATGEGFGVGHVRPYIRGRDA